MAHKQCTKCGQWKDEEEFNWRWKALGKRHAECRECHKITKGSYYERNKVKRIAGVMLSKTARRGAARMYIYEYLETHPCVECGETDPVVLEFHHVRGKKREAISMLATYGASIEVIREEIEKCDVLCSNCHRRKTAKEQGWVWGRRESNYTSPTVCCSSHASFTQTVDVYSHLNPRSPR